MKDFVIQHLDAIVTAVIGGASGWFFTRKQQAAEVKVTEGNALEGMQRAYDKLVEDMNAKFEELKKDNADLKAEVEHLHTENKELKRLIKKMQAS